MLSYIYSWFYGEAPRLRSGTTGAAVEQKPKISAAELIESKSKLKPPTFVACSSNIPPDIMDHLKMVLAKKFQNTSK
uniref:Uncharacterized protein n=1 Tax=viral metagenome TaxID=1070528 RepID=A0A6C0CJ44_9ZZZZ